MSGLFRMSSTTRTLGATLALSAIVFAMALSTLCASLPSHARIDPDTAPRWAVAFLSICTIGSDQSTNHGSGHGDHSGDHSRDHGGDQYADQHCAMCYAICAALAATIAAALILLLAGNAGSRPRPAPVARLRIYGRWFSFQGRAPPQPV